MNKYILIIISAAFISGCAFTTKPNQDLGFAEAKSLAEFEGCYENCSDTSDGSALTCLSGKIWPKVFDPNNMPDEIFVEAKNNSELTVTAFKLGNEVEKSLFIEGEHFTFIKGRIELKREYIASGATEPGNVFIGVGTGKTVLGIDAKGEGRVEQSTSFAGTGFLVIPIAASGTDISKIRRKGASCNES
ncbi:hypothetical protein [Endozoicomonas arenosclerae]|uniref:hypothetical protein n=1 Tax=Endozoicomonas arenosclerae TaxID=1633495 RepID=UPI000782E9FA|nr:hypothetical protein [Endozoicomonas arenosclerae]